MAERGKRSSSRSLQQSQEAEDSSRERWSSSVDKLLDPDLPRSGNANIISGNANITDEAASKRHEILKLCQGDADDEQRTELVQYATKDLGLVDDAVRRYAWPLLLDLARDQATGEKASLTSAPDDQWSKLPRHRDEDQVQLDVNRAFVYYPRNESDPQLSQRKEELSKLIVHVLRQHPKLCYFQGYHDIAQVCLLVLGPRLAPAALTRLSLLHIRDFMLPSLSPSIAHLNLLPGILALADPKLYRHLSSAPTTAAQPFFFALPATLTMYAHDIQEYGDIARLFDFLIAQPSVISIYFFAVIIVARRDELFEVDPYQEPEMLHAILCKLPTPLDLEGFISRTMELFQRLPPERLPGLTWWRVSDYSVLKTTRWSAEARRSRHKNSPQTIADGERLFEHQLRDLARQERRRKLFTQAWQYRRLLASTSVAVVFGLVSYDLACSSSLLRRMAAAIFGLHI